MKKLVITYIIIFVFTNLSGQNQDIAYPHIIPMSPNAAELAKYADYPVTHYSGIPNINVPLYEIDMDGFKLPISLNYHASGIRVDQEATWVGLGWSLDVGSRISRSVRGADDFFRLPDFDRNYPKIINGYYEAPDISSALLNQYQLNAYAACPPVYAEFYNDLIYDPEPDIFYYNLPGMNGKFILDKSRGAVLFDKHHNLKIEVISAPINTYPNPVSFKITDKEGNQYLYNKREITKNYTENTPLNMNIHNTNTLYDDNITNYIEWYQIRLADCSYDYEANPQAPYPMVTSWCLDKVITKHGREINFTYESDIQYLPTQESCENYRINSPIGSTNYTNNIYYYRSKVVNDGLRLSSIEGDFGRVEFSCSLRDDIKGVSKKLDSVSIYNNENTLVKSYRFDYDYFNDDYNGNVLYEHVFKRLKLNKLTEYSAGNEPLNGGHSFEYYEGNFPPKNSKNIDYWGFQNGKSYGPNYYIGISLPNDVNHSGVTKDMDFEKTIIGTLKKITYPTGGEAEFTFESNTIPSGYFETHTYDPASTYTIDLPVYNYYSVAPWDENTPSQDVYSFEIVTQTTLRIACSLENQSTLNDPDYVYNSSPLGSLKRITPSLQTLHTYVCPYVYDNLPSTPPYNQGQGSELTLNELEFTLEAGTYEFIAHTPPKDVQASWRLFFREHFIITPGTPLVPFEAGGIRISEIKTDAKTRKFNYPIGMMLTEPVLYYHGRRVGLPDYIESCTVQVSESKAPLSTFNNGNFVGYDWVEEYITDADNNVSKVKYKFFNDTESDMFDVRFPDSPRYINYTNGLITSIEKYKNTTLVERDDFLYNSTYSDYIKAFKDRSQKYFVYDILEYYYRVEWPLKSSQINTLRTDNGQNIVSQTNFTYNSRDMIESTSYELNNSNLIETVKYPFDFSDPVSVSMVGKNMIGIPVKKETFRDSEKIFDSETVYKNWGNDLFAPEIIKTSKGSSGLEDRLKYNLYDEKGNLLEVEKKEGMKISYIWGYNNTLPVAKVENMAYSSIPANLITAIHAATTESALLTALAFLRDHTSLANAMVTTYTYIPLVGIKTMTDPKGYTITYHYDAFNRLERVTDMEDNILSENQYRYRTQN